MQIQARSTADENPFGNSHRVFTELTDRLASREALGMRHEDLERLLDEDGRELLRQLLQDHIDYRGPGEACGEVVGASNGEALRAQLDGIYRGKILSEAVDAGETHPAAADSASRDSVKRPTTPRD